MKLLTNKNTTQKIIIALVFVILFNFVSPQISFGATIGGVLFEPIKDLTLTIADGAVWTLQKIIFGLDTSIIKLEHDDSIWPTIAAIGSGILAGVGFVVGWIAAPFTAGTSLSLSLLAAGLVVGGGTAYVVGKGVASIVPQTFYLPLYSISPAEIFSNKIATLDVNFFNPNKYDPASTGIGTTGSKEQISAAAQLQAVISQWYFTIRNFAIVALLSILVYTGIRIVISSSAQDKAKYKQRLVDWLVAMCLLFFLHYIMAFAVTITELITKSLNGVNQQYIQIIGPDNDKNLKDYHWNFQITKEDGETEDITDNLWAEDSELFDTLHKNGFIIDGRMKEDGTTENDGYTLVWPTNLMGKARIEAQLKVDGEDGDNTLIRQFGFTIIFLGLVIYTVLFLFRYLKRLLMLAFLTIIAPFVAMTYPLDKMNDGNAQAFNMWLKEYIYNLLIQPVHLVLYTVLIGTAVSFVADNLLYALAAFGFILQAEKIMRKFFGFEKASTLAGGSALGGAMAMQGINMLRRIGKGKKGSQKGGGKGGNEVGDGNSKVRFADRKADKGKGIDDLLDSNNGGGGGGLPIPQPTNPLDHTSDEGNRIKDNRASYKEQMEGLTDQEDRDALKDAWSDVKESDTRGMGQWIYDSYQGSGLQTGIHRSKEHAKDWVKDKGTRIANSKVGTLTRDLSTSGKAKIHDMANRANKIRMAIPKPIRNTANRAIKGATTFAKGAGAVALKGAGAGIKYAAPRAAKLAVKGTVAGAAAMGGIAAGLVSDDYGNVGKWGAAGAGAGWIGASGAISSGTNMVEGASEAVTEGIETAASTYTVAAHGQDAEEQRLKDKSDRAAMMDKERRKLYENKLSLSAKQAKEAMEKAQKYRESGITDDELIIKSMKAKTFTSAPDSNERIIAAKLASEVGKEEKKMKYVKEELKKKGVSQDDIDRYETGIKEINKWTI